MPFDAAALKQKIGPLPLYAWGGIGAAGLAALVLLMRKKGTGAAVATPGAAPPALDSSGVGAYTSGGGGSPYSYGNTYVCPDGSYAAAASLCPPTNTAPLGSPQNPNCPPPNQLVNGWCMPPTTTTQSPTAPLGSPQNPNCPPPNQLVNGWCVPAPAPTPVSSQPLQCPPGQVNLGSECVKATGNPYEGGPTCPPGTILLTNGQCGVLPFGANSSLQHQALGVGSGTAALFSV